MQKKKTIKKRFLDTNCFVRYIIGDIPNLAQEVENIFKQHHDHKVLIATDIYILTELSYVLNQVYLVENDIVHREIQNLLDREFLIPKIEVAQKGLDIYGANNLDITDCMAIAECLITESPFYSFDKQAKKVAKELGAKVQP
jgi:predicted nucleic-acid-binding protein